MDPICDLLYHIKYICVGHIIKNEPEAFTPCLAETTSTTRNQTKFNHNIPATNVNNITSRNQFPVTQSFSNINAQQQQQQPQLQQLQHQQLLQIHRLMSVEG
uniref:Uncharacterized protein n=1 Tax=Glossina austeni TaxID=7395 RepID=A0A1A9V0T0_GLOAU